MSHILAVDDQRIIRELLLVALTRLGHRVTLACSGMEAITLCRKHSYDLLILDYRMPDLTGLEVVQCLKGRVRCILHTSDYDNWDIQLQAIRLGILGVIAKISNLSAFQCSIDAFLNEADSSKMRVPVDRFPFVQRTSMRTDRSRWLAEEYGYGAACAKGREYAAYIALYLKANPSFAGSNIISKITQEMEFSDDSDSKGYRVGFFSFLEMMVQKFSRDHDVCSYLDRINNVYAATEMAREQEGKS